MAGATGIGGLIFGSIDAAKGAGQSKRASAAAAAERTAGLNRAKTELAPWKAYGQDSLARQNRLFEDPSYLENTGQYKFMNEQGLKATTAQRSRSSIFSGETLKALTEYSAGLASKSYNDEWTRLQSGVDIGFKASGMTAEMEAGVGEAGARQYDTRTGVAANQIKFGNQMAGWGLSEMATTENRGEQAFTSMFSGVMGGMVGGGG